MNPIVKGLSPKMKRALFKVAMLPPEERKRVARQVRQIIRAKINMLRVIKHCLHPRGEENQ